MYKLRGKFVLTGGSALLGADTNIYRQTTNTLKTDDAFTVAGALTASSTLDVTGRSTFSGTPHVLPYGTVSPTHSTNGQIGIYHKANVPYLHLRSGGTSYVIQLPVATGSMSTGSCIVNSIP